MFSAKLLLAYLLQAATLANPTVDISKVNIDEAYCLAKNVYYESKSESIRGQFAVASVTVNRTQDPRFPDTVCEVVHYSSVSRISKKLVCQFSWYCEREKRGKNIPVTNKDGTVNQVVVDQFQVASMVAITVLSGQVDDNTNGATHFHNPNISFPDWRHEMKRTLREGNHDFYRMPE
jgi:spore germination cell wall hydrolase CwlJ-like protein